ncbi:MAG: hypothetical protein AMXMBFR47_29100 [Planctomycetota bacterium]
MQPAVAYIIGPPRSGTTLLASMLAAGDGVLSLSEPWLAQAILPVWRRQRFFRRMQTGGGLPRVRPPFDDRREAFARFLVAMAQRGGFSTLLIKETFRDGFRLASWNNLDLMDALVDSGAPCVAVVRDPFAVAASSIRLAAPLLWLHGWFGAAYRLLVPFVPAFRTADDVVLTAARNWVSFAAWQQRHALPIVRYEDLVRSPETTFPRVCEHLHIPFQPHMLDPRSAGRSFGGFGDPETMQRPRPVHHEAIHRGNDLTPRQREIVHVTCHAAAMPLGYDTAAAERAPASPG